MAARIHQQGLKGVFMMILLILLLIKTYATEARVSNEKCLEADQSLVVGWQTSLIEGQECGKECIASAVLSRSTELSTKLK